VLQARGRAQLRAGNDDAAFADFVAGVAALEERQRTLTDASLRASALDPAWPLFTDLIRMELKRSRWLAALAYAERAKRQSLDARMPACLASVEQSGADESCWTQGAAGGVTGLYYVVLDDRLVIWVLTPTGVRHATVPIPAARLRNLVDQYRNALTNPAAASRVDEISGELYAQLISPVSAWLRDAPALVVVPDDALHGVPFAALVDRETGKYLLERHLVLLSPSYSHFTAASARMTGPLVMKDARAVVVGDPTLSGVTMPLPPLPGARAEAEHLSRLVRDVEMLSGAQATATRLREALREPLPGAQILHLASHAMVNHRAPWRSFFVLAPDQGKPGTELLFMSEISTLPLERVMLAVLAACGSADGPVARGGTPLSLARPFLAQGVPNVVATLWPVSDRAARRLFTAFYTHLAEGAAPAEALRDAQLELLRDGSQGFQNPAFWAPFVVIGGSSQAATKRGGS
jgi:CHAT domain-containing protein